MWDQDDWATVSMVSVAPCNRPKTDASLRAYSFNEEAWMQMEKMRTVLRIAARNGHVNLILSQFGSGHRWGDEGPSHGHTNPVVSGGSVYANPTPHVAMFWNQLLREEPEFIGYFSDVVFVITGGEGEHHDFYRNMARSEYIRYFG